CARNGYGAWFAYW
nr:immunoglobulin heavy chain junction region [Mus musculus]